MGKNRLTLQKGIVPLGDLLEYFSDIEVERMFYEKTRLALNISSLSKMKIPMAEIRTLRCDIDTLAVEMQERRKASRPQSRLHTPRFSDECTRRKINVLKVYPKAEERQKHIRIPNRTFNNVMGSNVKPKSPRGLRGLIVGKTIKIIEEQEAPEVKRETLKVNVVNIGEDFCPPIKKFTKQAAHKVTKGEGQCPIIEIKHKYNVIKTSGKIENAKRKKTGKATTVHKSINKEEDKLNKQNNKTDLEPKEEKKKSKSKKHRKLKKISVLSKPKRGIRTTLSKLSLVCHPGN